MRQENASTADVETAPVRLSHVRPERNRVRARISLLQAAPPGTSAGGASFSRLMEGFESLSEEAARRLGLGGPIMEVQAGWLACPCPGPFEAEAVLVGEGGGYTVWQLSLSKDGKLVASAAMKRAAAQPEVTTFPEQAPAPDNNGRTERELRVQSNADRQRERIAEAAAEIIAAKGFAQATVRQIADAAGLHVPTLYTYVASKDDLLELVYTASMDRILLDVAAATAGCRTPREKIAVAIRETLARIESNRRRIGVMNRELRSLPPEARTRVLERYRVVLNQVADIVREGIDAGEFRPVEAFIIANMIDAICDMRALRPFSLGAYDPEAFAHQVLAFVEKGLAADRARCEPVGKNLDDA